MKSNKSAELLPIVQSHACILPRMAKRQLPEGTATKNKLLIISAVDESQDLFHFSIYLFYEWLCEPAAFSCADPSDWFHGGNDQPLWQFTHSENCLLPCPLVSHLVSKEQLAMPPSCHYEQQQPFYPFIVMLEFRVEFTINAVERGSRRTMIDQSLSA